jgi:hypothetical protein
MPRWSWRALFGGRELTEAERHERDGERTRARQAEALRTELSREAVEYAEHIRATLTRYGVAKQLKDDDGTKWVREVRFYKPYVATEEAIKIKVNTRNLPNGVSLADLRDDRVLELLSVNCGRRVIYRYTPEGGFWYWIEREAGVGGVPRYVAFEDMLKRRPANTNRLGIPIGVGENKRDKWVTVPEMVHLLVAGSTDSGKSNFLNVLLCTLLRHNTPGQLQLVLVDFKGGMELSFYDGLPHLPPIPRLALKAKRKRKDVAEHDEPDDPDDEATAIAAGEPDVEAPEDITAADEIAAQHEITQLGAPRASIIEHRRELPGVLYWLIREAERRMKLIRDARCKKLSEYNQKNSLRPLPRILLVIDEWADVRLDEELGARAERMLVNLCDRARAVGVHVIVCTQSPVKEVLTARLRNAFVSKMVFGLADQYISMSLLGSAQAANIRHPGRGILRVGRALYEVQVPLIPNHIVEEYVEAAKGGKAVELVQKRRHDVSEQEILDWAMRHNQGRLSSQAIYDNFRERGYPRDEAERIGRRLEGQTVIANEIECRVMKPAKPFDPRRLIPVTDPPPPVQTDQASPGAPASGDV